MALVFIPVVLNDTGAVEEWFESDNLIYTNQFDIYLTLVPLVVSAVYYLLQMPRTNGQTLGKMATGIRIVRESGQPVDVGFTLFRQTLVIYCLFSGLAIFLLFIPTILNYLWPLWDDRNQALHDKIVKSRVVLVNP